VLALGRKVLVSAVAPTRIDAVSLEHGHHPCFLERLQALVFEVALGSAGVLAGIVQIALGHDAKGADSGKHAAFGAVDLVHVITLSNWPSFTRAG
jgi:hypothetical protein